MTTLSGEKRGHHGHHRKSGSVSRKKGVKKSQAGNTTLTGAHMVGTDGRLGQM
jgi:hypothetical protein